MKIRGTFVDTPSLGELEIYHDYLINITDEGYITHFDPFNSSSSQSLIDPHDHDPLTTLAEGSFILPTFTDLHLHAPQYLYAGNGLDLPLMEWLDKYTYKAEESLDADPALARRVYTRLAERLVKNGTGAVSLFGTIKEKTNLILAQEMQRAGVRARVGKLSMDISSRPTYVEASAEESLRAVESFVESCTNNDQVIVATPNSLNKRIVEPVLTPRFVPTCSDTLLRGLSALSSDKGLYIQSHLAEARDQVDWVRNTRGLEDIDVFDEAGLLGERTLMAHCTFLSLPNDSSKNKFQRDGNLGPAHSEPHPSSQDPERSIEPDPRIGIDGLTRLARNGVSIAHCPLSNVYFSEKPFPLREALDLSVFKSKPSSLDPAPDSSRSKGLKIGLGTDIAGGYTGDMMHAMRWAVGVSRMREGARCEREREHHEQNKDPGGGDISRNQEKSLAVTYKEALFLATRGGALALGLAPRHPGYGQGLQESHKVGGLWNGGVFDAQLIELWTQDNREEDGSNEVRGTGNLDFFDLHFELNSDKSDTDEGRPAKGNRASDMVRITEDMIEKWWCLGDDRNRIGMWVQGRKAL